MYYTFIPSTQHVIKSNILLVEPPDSDPFKKSCLGSYGRSYADSFVDDYTERKMSGPNPAER